MRPPAPADFATASSSSVCLRDSVAPPGTRIPRTRPPRLDRLLRRTRNPTPRNASRHVEDLEPVAQVRPVAAIPLHRVGVRHAAETAPASSAACVRQSAHDQPFGHGHDVFARDEGRLDVDLRELRLAVRAQILVAEAARDLEVPIEPGDHQQLLV